MSNKTKLILRESQFKMLEGFINESKIQSNMIRKIVSDLNNNYKKALKTNRVGNEYKNEKVFEVVVDGELISAKDLKVYLVNKYSVGDEFIKQLLNDWCDNKLDDYELSKHVPMNK